MNCSNKILWRLAVFLGSLSAWPDWRGFPFLPTNRAFSPPLQMLWLLIYTSHEMNHHYFVNAAIVLARNSDVENFP